LWAGDGGEGAKFWLAVLTDIKNRGVEDVCIAVCGGLKGLPEAITTVWPPTVVQTCLIHLLRNTFRYAARQYWDEMSRALRPIYTAPTEAAAKERFVEFVGKWASLRRFGGSTRRCTDPEDVVRMRHTLDFARRCHRLDRTCSQTGDVISVDREPFLQPPFGLSDDSAGGQRRGVALRAERRAPRSPHEGPWWCRD